MIKLNGEIKLWEMFAREKVIAREKYAHIFILDVFVDMSAFALIIFIK